MYWPTRCQLSLASGLIFLLNFATSAPTLKPTSLPSASAPVSEIVSASSAKIVPTVDDKLRDLKAHAQNHLSSKSKAPKIFDKGSKLEGEDSASTAESDAPSDSTEGDDTEAKANFWKHMIGGGGAMGMMGGESSGDKPPSSIPTLVYLLPVVGFIGVGFAVLAYFAFGT